MAASGAIANAAGGGSADDVRAGTVNTLHAVLKLLASHDDEEKSRIALLVLRPCMSQHSYDTSQVRSPQETAEHFAHLADWGFMEELRAVVATLRDLKGMQRIGLHANFDSHTLGQASNNQGMVDADDSLATLQWRLVSQVLVERGTSMLWHVWSVPGIWAGFLSADADVVQHWMSVFKLLWSSYVAAKAHALPTARQVADRHPCDCRAAQDMARLCTSSGWTINDRIRFRVALIYKGICQEKFVEDALGDCRDAEVRQGTNKELKCTRYWEVLMQMKQFEKNRRREVEPNEEVSLPHEKEFNTVFDPNHVEDDDANLKGVLTTQCYSPNTSSEKDHMVDAMMLAGLWEQDMLGSIDDSWQAFIVPAKQFI